MTDEERKALLLEKAKIQERLAKAEGKPLPKATLKGQDEEVFAPSKSAASPLATLLNQPLSGRMAASQAALPTPKAKARPVNAPDTGATSLVANKISTRKTKRFPSAIKEEQMARGREAQRKPSAGDVRQYESRTTGKPSAGDVRAYESTQRPARPVETPAQKFAKDMAMYLNPSADTSRSGTLANLLTSSVGTLPGVGSPEALRGFEKSTESMAGKMVGENYDPTDPESALLTALTGIGPAVGGQAAMGAVGKLLPKTLNPLLAGGAKLGGALAGGAGAGYLQGKATESIASGLGQEEAYKQKQAQVAEFSSRHQLLSALLQGSGGMAMQRPSLGASMAERGAGFGLGLATSVGGDIITGQPLDWQKGVAEGIANAVTAGPNTKLGDFTENLGAKAVVGTKKAIAQAPYRGIPGFNAEDAANADMSQVMPDSPYVPRTITKQAPPRMEDAPLSKPISFVDPNAKTTRVPVTEAPVTQPEYWTGAGMAKTRMAQRERANAKAVLPTPETPATAPEPIAPAPTPEAYPVRPDLQMKPLRDESAEDFSKRQQVASSWVDHYEREIARLKKLPARANSQEWTNVSLGDTRSDSTKAGTLRLLAKRLSQLKSDPDYHSGFYSDLAPSAKTPEPIAPVPAQPVKETAETFTRPAEPVKETQKSEQVDFNEGDIVESAGAKFTFVRKLPNGGAELSSDAGVFEVDNKELSSLKFVQRKPSASVKPEYHKLKKADFVSYALTQRLDLAKQKLAIVTDKVKGIVAKSDLKVPSGISWRQALEVHVNESGRPSKELRAAYRELTSAQDGVSAAQRAFNEPSAIGTQKSTEEAVHENLVRNALGQGKPVPPEVLADYPDLAAKYGKSTPEPSIGEVAPPVVKEPLTTAKQDSLATKVKLSLANLNSPDKATSEAARASLDESLATLRDNAIIKGEGVKTTGKVTDKDTFAQSVKEAFGVTDEQAGELADLVDDWANGWAKKEKESGRLPDATAADFYATIGGIHRFDDDLAQLVLDKKAATSKGVRLPESNVIIALQKGDTTTAVHEMAHHFLDTLPEAARKKVMDSLPGTTSANVHEQFATGFEAGLKDVNSPLHRYYKKFKLWIDETYKGLVNKWKSLAGYEEGALKVTSTEQGKNIVSFTTGLKGDALDVVMDYINTGRIAKQGDGGLMEHLRSEAAKRGETLRGDKIVPESAVEGVPAPKVDAVAPKSEPVQVSKGTTKAGGSVNNNTGLTKTQSDYFLRELLKKREELAPDQTPAVPGAWEKPATYGGKKLIKYGRGDFTTSVRQSSKLGTLWQVAPGHDTTWKVAAEGESYADLRSAKAAAERLSLALERGEKGVIPEDFTVEVPGGAKYKVRGTLDAIDTLITNLNAKSSEPDLPAHLGISSTTPKQMAADVLRSYGSAEKAASAIADLMTKAEFAGTLKAPSRKRLTEVIEELVGRDRAKEFVGQYEGDGEPQFQTDDSANESTILGIPLKNAAIQGYFDVNPETLKDNSTTIEAERKKALALANSPGFAEKVVSDILDGRKVITPTLTAENMVAAAEAARRRMAWETAKAGNTTQVEVDKAFADYMKFVQATKDIGTEAGRALRMRQEAIGGDPLDPDSYISRAASTFTRDLNDPAFKEFVDKITAKSAVARQSYDNLQAEITRLNTQVEELLKGTPAETEAKKAEAEQQLFGTTAVPKRKKVAEGTTEATEGQKSTGGTTASAASKVSGTTAKVKSAGRDRAFAKLTSDKISDSVSSLAKEALSIAKGLAAKYGDKKPQFQTDDEVDVDTQDISDFRRDMIGVGRGLLAAGTRNFKTWKEEIDGILDDAGIDPLEEHQYQVLWVDSKLSLRDEVGDVQSIKSSTAGTTIQQVIGSLGLDGAGRWLDGISDQDGNPTIFEKMVKGEALTPAELDGAARVWMQVQRASGLKVSKRGKVGALADIKRVAGELRRASAPTTDMPMDSALSSIKRMTDKLGKQSGTTTTPVLRARLSRFNALAVALAKKSIGTDKGQLSTTEFTTLVDSAAQAFKDAGSDVEKHQQVLRDLRSSVLKARGLDPNARYQFSGKSDATLRAETDAKFAQNGQALVDLVKSYASGRKQSLPSPLLDIATVEYAKAGNSIVSWAKAVENRWGSKLDRDQLNALYAQAGMKFASMNDPATGVPYAVQIRRIKEQMEYEVQKLTYDKLSPADKAIRSLGEIGMAITGNVASFDYSFAGRQAGMALLSPKDYAKALLAGVKATGIGKVSPEQQALLFDNVSSAFFNDRFGSADYYKKAGLEITDDAFSDIYTHHGLITPNGMFVSNALSTVGVKPILSGAAWVSDKRGNTAKAEALRARGEAMVGPGQRSEAMNRMFVKQLRFDLFRRVTKDGMVYKGLTDQLEAATTDAERAVIQKKITYQDEYNKMMSKLISITTGKAAVERASVRNMLTTLGRVGVWSPSFWLSRVQAMTAYPAWDVLLGQNDLKAVDRLKLAAYPIALQQAEIQAFNLALFLLSRIPGVQIMATDDDESGKRKTPWNWLGADPLNTDFGKVKYEGQEYDLSAGMRKHIVFAQRSYELAAQGYEDWWREQKGQLPKDNEYDPYYDSKVTPEDGKRQLIQYIKSSMNPVAGTMYDIMRGGAEDALGRKMSPLETSLRMIVPIPLANVAYSTFVDRPEESRRAAQTQDPALMQRVQDNNNTFVRDTVLTSFADMVGVSSAVRDRELEDGIKQASKHSGWMSKGYIPSKKDDELRNQVTKLIKDSIALSGTGTTYPSKKEVDMQAREMLKMIPLAKMDRESLLSVKNQFAEQVTKGKKVHKYMKTTQFSINGNLPK